MVNIWDNHYDDVKYGTQSPDNPCSSGQMPTDTSNDPWTATPKFSNSSAAQLSPWGFSNPWDQNNANMTTFGLGPQDEYKKVTFDNPWKYDHDENSVSESVHEFANPFDGAQRHHGVDGYTGDSEYSGVNNPSRTPLDGGYNGPLEPYRGY